ncbi:isopenicillin N synthase family oxygenase [Ignatzschineria indica]|uniref:isopenicillin N synthase family dioxygenase n=1 Tax=Ignatzschineria indica TaxID=472583 RepID=UPI00257878AE|nr:2-oxoglutarate and iron-dependent oxygenase domain-containing protein [Ignatzschineria indica]MDM1546032.1 isopenicillin N synthase family oxygenase [Ignatzschineria indica]
MSLENPQLPILDYHQFLAGGDEREAFLESLRYAAHEIGFFYLKNHNIPQSLIEKAQRLAKEFFALPLEEKLAIHMSNSPHFRGYTNIHDEITREKPDSREQFDFMPEYEAIPLDQIPHDQPWLRLQGPNQWPDSLPELRPTFIELQERQTELAKSMLTAFALALGQDEEIFAPTYAHKPSVLSKAIHYPGVDGEQGVGPHKDSGYITFVQQEDQAGLEVLKDDEWVLAEPIEGTFVVNIGELLEIASQGYLKATLHRVLPSPIGQDRYSIAYFLTSQLDATVPLLTLPKALQGKSFSITQDPKNPLFTQIGKNFLKGRLRSHPDVAARFYADISIDE